MQQYVRNFVYIGKQALLPNIAQYTENFMKFANWVTTTEYYKRFYIVIILSSGFVGCWVYSRQMKLYKYKLGVLNI